MHTEDEFLQTLLDNPADDTARLVYADWLDEQDDPTARRKSEFLRLELSLPRITGVKNRDKKAARKRLQELAAELSTDWLAVVSRLEVENCGVQFEFVCPKKWEQLYPTDSTRVRFCSECCRNVYYAGTIQDARKHAWGGECVAVDLGVIRRDRDLEYIPMRMGFAPYTRAEEELMKPDPVSEERERRKR